MDTRKVRIAYVLAEELRRIAILISLNGMCEVVKLRLARFQRMIDYFRVNL